MSDPLEHQLIIRSSIKPWMFLSVIVLSGFCAGVTGLYTGSYLSDRTNAKIISSIRTDYEHRLLTQSEQHQQELGRLDSDAATFRVALTALSGKVTALSSTVDTVSTKVAAHDSAVASATATARAALAKADVTSAKTEVLTAKVQEKTIVVPIYEPVVPASTPHPTPPKSIWRPGVGH